MSVPGQTRKSQMGKCFPLCPRTQTFPNAVGTSHRATTNHATAARHLTPNQAHDNRLCSVLLSAFLPQTVLLADTERTGPGRSPWVPLSRKQKVTRCYFVPCGACRMFAVETPFRFHRQTIVTVSRPRSKATCLSPCKGALPFRCKPWRGSAIRAPARLLRWCSSASRCRRSASYSNRSCDRRLRGLPFFDDLPEIRCQLAIVMSKHLIEGLLGPVRRLSNSLFVLRGLDLVLLHFRLKIGHHGTPPRDANTTLDSTLPCAENMAALRKFSSAGIPTELSRTRP